MVSFLPFITFALAGMVVASPLELKVESNLGKRGNTVDCNDGTQAPFISDGLSEAVSFANAAIDYINAHGVNGDVFINYFGDVQDFTTQLGVFQDVVNANSLTLSCSDPSSTCTSNSDIAKFGAYNDGLNIYFCPSFYNQVDTGQLCSTGATVNSVDIRGATLLQQITSSVDQTTPLYGCIEAWGRAQSDPAAAARTGDNYRCFAEQVYINGHCPVQPPEPNPL